MTEKVVGRTDSMKGMTLENQATFVTPRPLRSSKAQRDTSTDALMQLSELCCHTSLLHTKQELVKSLSKGPILPLRGIAQHLRVLDKRVVSQVSQVCWIEGSRV